MKLEDAMRRGTRIKRKSWLCPHMEFEPGTCRNFSYEDILANDWEVKEKEITITKTKFLDAYSEALKEVEQNYRYRFPPQAIGRELLEEITQRLGL